MDEYFESIPDEVFATLDWTTWTVEGDNTKENHIPTLVFDAEQIKTILSDEYKPTPIIPGPLKPIIKKQIKRGNPIPPLFQRFNK